MIGIQGAPDSLPDADHLVRNPWSVCVRNGTTRAGGTAPVTSLVAGKSVGGHALGDGEAVAVQAGGQAYVIWKNQRMRMAIPPKQAAGVTRGVQPAPVSQAWLNTINQGPDFKAPDVPSRGSLVPGIGGDARVGQVFKAQPTGSWNVLLSDGFAPISETQAILLLNDPATRIAYHGAAAVARDIDAATVNSKLSHQSLLDPRLPPTMPNFVQWDGSAPLCAVYADTDKGSVTARLSIGGSLPDVDPNLVGRSGTVDQVIMPPRSAALVGLLPGPGQLNAINSWYLVDDAGVKFPLSSKDTVEKLGYQTDDAAPIPQSLLQLMPTGPRLDPKAALNPVPTPKGVG
jgi:type VII secretion protein EccB